MHGRGGHVQQRTVSRHYHHSLLGLAEKNEIRTARICRHIPAENESVAVKAELAEQSGGNIRLRCQTRHSFSTAFQGSPGQHYRYAMPLLHSLGGIGVASIMVGHYNEQSPFPRRQHAQTVYKRSEATVRIRKRPLRTRCKTGIIVRHIERLMAV